ncbi:MAG: exonuclease domain-containing protein [Micrococcales bacterium]|nr:exonuclease domain-containing protein [Micrococcales bacterium]MCL2667658.1 exonuclease domain-containing protein [Micrococcales bacterium]
MTRSWWPGPLLGFDTETTGVDVTGDRIVTAALVRRDADGTHTRNWLLNPGVEIPAIAVAIHGVTTDQARTQGTAPGQALDEIADTLVTALRQDIPVVAFNARFDLRLLDAELTRHELPTLPDRLGHPVRPVLDPLILDRALDPDRHGPRTLGDLCHLYDVPTGSLHTADADVIATLDLLAHLVTRHPTLATTDLHTLHDQQRTWAQTWHEAFLASHPPNQHP